MNQYSTTVPYENIYMTRIAPILDQFLREDDTFSDPDFAELMNRTILLPQFVQHWEQTATPSHFATIPTEELIDQIEFDLILELTKDPWDSEEQRQAFIYEMTGEYALPA